MLQHNLDSFMSKGNHVAVRESYLTSVTMRKRTGWRILAVKWKSAKVGSCNYDVESDLTSWYVAPGCKYLTKKEAKIVL